MAKDSRDTGSKSEAIPGGTKASDLPASVGGTRDSSPGASPSGQPAPVTTDAAAHTPARPDEALVPPGADTRASGTPRREPGRSYSGPIPPGEEDYDRPLSGHQTMTGAADVSVNDLAGNVRDFVQKVKAHDWAGAWKAGGAIVSVFAGLMDSGAFSPLKLQSPAAGSFSPTGREGPTDRDFDRLGVELASVRNELSTALASGRRASWTGGDPHPDSGSPAPQGAPAAHERHAAIDPQAILVLYELVSKIWSHFSEARQVR